MINVLKVVDEVWKHLNGGLLNSVITGGIYKYKRPVNSGYEDVVIDSLGINNASIQNGIVTVHIYVPDLNIKVNGIETKNIPDHTRLLALTTIALSELDEVWNADQEYTFSVQQHILEEDEIGSFINIRLEFSSINTK